MATQVVIVQHAEKERLPGDPGLTPWGREQAARTAEYLSRTGAQYAGVFSSPMKRARQSAAPIGAALGLAVRVDDRIRERANWNGPETVTSAAFLADWERSNADRSYQPTGGDSSYAAAARFRDFLDELADGAAYVVVAHGGVTTDLLRDILGDEKLSHRAPPLMSEGLACCGLTRITRVRLGQSAWEVLSIADASHLSEEAES